MVPDVAVDPPVAQASRECRRRVVAALGDERADVGVHSPGLGEKDAAAGRDRLLAVEDVLEDRGAGAARVIGLGDLRKLLRVAEQDKIRGGESDGGGVRERELAGLVDEHEVELLAVLLAREQPRGAGDELVIVGRRRRCRRPGRSARAGSRSPRPCRCRRTSDPARARAARPRRSRFWIAAWLGAVMPTRRPPASAATIIRAPRKVLPVPGGPWTGRTEWSSPRVADTSASMSSPSPPDVSAGGSRRSRERTAWNLLLAGEDRRGEGHQRLAQDRDRDRPSRRQARRVPGPVASRRGGGQRGSPRRRRRCSARRSWGRRRRRA